MGSKFLDLYTLDPLAVRAAVQGQDLDAVIAAMEGAPAELEFAFEHIAEGVFCFLPKGKAHPKGLHYCRAVERIIGQLTHARHGVEFYPDEGEYALWSLAFDPCDAPWLALPATPNGVGDLAWRSPDTCRGLSVSMQRALSAGSFNPSYVSERELRGAMEVLHEASRSKRGVFTIYQA